MNKSVCDVLSVQHGARKRRVRWTQGDGFPIRAVNDVEVRNAPFDDGSVGCTGWMRRGFRSVHGDGSECNQRVHSTTLHHQGCHEGQTHRSAVWIKVAGERKAQIVFNNRVHVGPFIAHGVRCTGQEPSVDAGRVHPEARLHGGVVGVVGGRNAQRSR